jgi:putative transposase
MIRRGDRGIWQRRYWNYTIRRRPGSGGAFGLHSLNPVKHGLVEHPAEWPHSSFRRSVAGGLYPTGWMGASSEPPETGERR